MNREYFVQRVQALIKSIQNNVADNDLDIATVIETDLVNKHMITITVIRKEQNEHTR